MTKGERHEGAAEWGKSGQEEGHAADEGEGGWPMRPPDLPSASHRPPRARIWRGEAENRGPIPAAPAASRSSAATGVSRRPSVVRRRLQQPFPGADSGWNRGRRNGQIRWEETGEEKKIKKIKKLEKERKRKEKREIRKRRKNGKFSSVSVFCKKPGKRGRRVDFNTEK